jgi:signal transduction histidine kinase
MKGREGVTPTAPQPSMDNRPRIRTIVDVVRDFRIARRIGEQLVVSRGHLGLFDTPPGRWQVRLSIAIVCLLFAALLLLWPLGSIRLGEVVAFVPVVDAIMFISQLLIGTLFYAQAAVFRSRSLTVLASGYVAVGLFFVPHALTFPGAFSTDGLLGAQVNTTVWLAFFWRWTSPGAVLVYALLKAADVAAEPEAERPPARIPLGLSGAVAIAAGGTLLATVGHDLLPPLFLNNRDAIHANLIVVNAVTIALTLAAMVLLLRQKKSVLDVWLLVALSDWLVQSLLNLPLHARFTLGWYGLFGLMLVANMVVIIALVAESTRLYARLALSAAARDREREARLLSIDGVAAAIAHEVGQPLTAVTLNTTAGIDWLNRDPPNTEMAIKSLHAANDAGRRAFGVIRSVRTTYARGSGDLSAFSFNDLVRETAVLVDRELAAQKISLQLALDESLPPIRANRGQMQRVIVNLLTNAIDSVAAARRRTRRISLRSTPTTDQGILLDVSDSGVGIAAEKMAQIFEPYFTTKSDGTGVGLSLSRAIVEDHGGRLWASTGDHHGATFHLELPSRPKPKA